MKALVLSLCVVCSAFPAFAQSAEAMKYAPRPVALVSNDQTEGVMLIMFTVNGLPHLEFIPASKIAQAVKDGGQPVRYGDVLSVLGQAAQTIQQLQAENAELKAENQKLWKVALKNNPQQLAPPAPVVIQQPVPPPPSRLERYMLLRGLLPQTQPTQNIHVTVSNCTRYPALCVGR